MYKFGQVAPNLLAGKVEDQAARNPDAHELLGKIVEIDKARFMVANTAGKAQ